MQHSRDTQSEPPAATGERLVPERQHGELVHAEHLARYRFAARLAGGRRVLDAASGEGYGTAMVAAAGAKSVAGVDIDPGVVEHARGRYGLSFEAGDVADLPFDDNSFDLVVSFETIEHVADAPRTLAEFRRVLADDGTLLISTPNKHEYLVENEFHTREYMREEFVAMLEEVFPSVQVLMQHNWLVSIVGDESLAAEDGGETSKALDLYKVAGIGSGSELYSVALCGGSPLESPVPVAVAAGTDEAHELAVRLTSAEATAESWHREYVAAKDTAEDWHREYDEAKHTAEKWHKEFVTAKELAGKIRDECDRELEAVYDSISWRLTAPLRRVTAGVRGRRG